MTLYPAIRLPSGEIVKGQANDSHDTLIESKGITESLPDSARGFSPGGTLFLTRKSALPWLAKFAPDVYAKVVKVVPEDGLYSKDLADAKGIKQRDVSDVVDLSNKTCLVYGRKGLYLFLAQKLGQKFKKVWFYMAEANPYPTSKFKDVGKGLPEVERIYSFWPYVDKADLIFFGDSYDGDLQHYLRQKGYRVFGAGRSERMELDKVFFLEELHKVGLPVPYTVRVVGVDEAEEYLKNKGAKWIKTPYYREDFETMKYPGDMALFESKLNDVRHRLGERASSTIEILIQNIIKKKAEGGYDGFSVDGEYTKNSLIGYEIKDRGFIGKIFRDTPESVDKVNQALAPLYKKLGYRGHLSTEIIFDEKGRGYFIDATPRAPSPPAEGMCEHITNYPEACYLIAGGILPKLHWDNPYIAVVILRSPWHEEHELVVDFPDEHTGSIKLKNHLKENGKHHCIPAGNGSFFGAISASAKTWQEARDKVMAIAKTVRAEDIEKDDSLFDEAEEQIEAGYKVAGIDFSKAEI